MGNGQLVYSGGSGSGIEVEERWPDVLARLLLTGSHHELVVPEQHQLLGAVAISGFGVPLPACPGSPLRGLFGFRGRVFHILQLLLALLGIESPPGGELRPVVQTLQVPRGSLEHCGAPGGSCPVERRFGVYLESFPSYVR